MMAGLRWREVCRPMSESSGSTEKSSGDKRNGEGQKESRGARGLGGSNEEQEGQPLPPHCLVGGLGDSSGGEGGRVHTHRGQQ